MLLNQHLIPPLVLGVVLVWLLACKNGSAVLFTSSKISHPAKLSQVRIESKQRVLKMVDQMDQEGFGYCSNTDACEIECPQEISVDNKGRMNCEYLKAQLL